jgi:hypothetical protein
MEVSDDDVKKVRQLFRSRRKLKTSVSPPPGVKSNTVRLDEVKSSDSKKRAKLSL